MSLLDKLYGQAKGVGSGLDDMNKNLELMREEDKKYYKTEKSYRNQVQTQAKRERQDRIRLTTGVTETLNKAGNIGKPGNDSKVMGILTTALASVVVGVLAAKGLKPNKKKQEQPAPAAAPPAAPPSDPDKDDKEKTKTASPASVAAAFSGPSPKFGQDLAKSVVDILAAYKVENDKLVKRTKKLEVQAAYSKTFSTEGFSIWWFHWSCAKHGTTSRETFLY